MVLWFTLSSLGFIGFGVWGVWFRVQSLEFGFRSLWFRVENLGLGFQRPMAPIGGAARHQSHIKTIIIYKLSLRKFTTQDDICQ